MKLLIVSDIHGNWAALQSVLDAEADFDKILCLGDLVDYGPEPAACVTWAMQQRDESIFLQGNHDWGVAFNKDPRSSPPFSSPDSLYAGLFFEDLVRSDAALSGGAEAYRSFRNFR